jgi:anti-sigma regulatory factor (Ser/Thr protein kinase)
MPCRADGETRDVPATTTSTTPTLELSLAPEPESVRRLRRALARGGLDPDIDHTVTLLASEVVTNAIRHAAQHGPIRIEAVLEADFARVAVVDHGPGFSPDVRHDARGYGLRLVDKLASQWGVEPDAESGTRVWFEVDRRRRRFERS